MLAITGITAIGLANGQTEERNQSVSLPESGFVGDVFDIPKYVEGGRTADIRILSPDGIIYGGNKLSMTVAGVYTVTYSIEGKTVKTVKCLCKYRATDFFEVNDFAEIIGIGDLEHIKKYEDKFPAGKKPLVRGVKATVSKGAQIDFTKVIDFTERTLDDSLIEFAVEPREEGIADLGQIILTFTDVSNTNKFIKITVSDGGLDGVSWGGTSYIRAGANGQIEGGIDYGENGEMQFNTATIYGSPIPTSLRAEYFKPDGDGTPEFIANGQHDLTVKLFYDSKQNALYSANGCGQYYGQPYLIADFDDLATYGGSVWSGFSSGKTKLSITFDRFQNQSGSIIFKDIDGIDLSLEEFSDEEAPELEIEFNDQLVMPNSKVGNTYKLFSAVAPDFFDGNVKVETKVIYENVTNGKTYDVPVLNGEIITDKVGKYVVTYTAKDRFGNVASEQFAFYCYSEEEEITVDGVIESLTANVYDEITIQDVDELTARGGFGFLNITAEVYSPRGKRITPDKLGRFKATMLGDYTVNYIATDFFGTQGVTTATIHVEPVTTPIFTSRITLPEVVIEGFSYKLPKATAIVCSGKNMQIKESKVKVFVDGVEIVEKKDEDRVFVAPNADFVKVEYRAYYIGSNEYESQIFNIPVIDGKESKDQTVYFYDKDERVTVSEQKEYVELSFNEDSSVLFANLLNNRVFELSAIYDMLTTSYSAMRIVLSDLATNEVSVTFKLELTSSGIALSLPGGEASIPLAYKEGLFAVKYQHKKRMVYDVNDKPCAIVTEDDEGREFWGFSGGVYMRIFFDGVEGASSVKLCSLNGQELGYRKENKDQASDTVAPEINVIGEYVYKHNLGEEITVYNASAFDVLSQVTELTVKVVDPDGQIVLNPIETDKSYSFKLSKTGDYRIIYEAYDLYGNKTHIDDILIGSSDTTLPIYRFDASFDKYYRVGASITLPEVDVSDNCSTAYCDIFVELPSGEIRLLINYADGKTTSFLDLENGKYPNDFKVNETTFKLLEEGVYKVFIMIYDEAFNSQVFEYEFMAVGGQDE